MSQLDCATARLASERGDDSNGPQRCSGMASDQLAAHLGDMHYHGTWRSNWPIDAEGDPTMRYSRDHILTSHAGSLPRPDALIEANRARQSGEPVDETPFMTQLGSAVADVVRRQIELGIDVPGDGEFGKLMWHRVNYGAWWSYSFHRLEGLALGPGLYQMPAPPARPGEVTLTSMANRRDRTRFAAAYADPEFGYHDRTSLA